SGSLIDSSQPDADNRLRHLEPALHQGLDQLSQQVRNNPTWLATIAAQYSMKNTMGYGLNSLVDFTRPIDILTHLMVGSEGTLGFIASATFKTLPVAQHMATALLVFPSVHATTEALPALIEAGATVLELMDPASIKAAQQVAKANDPINQIKDPTHTALLVEIRATSLEALQASQSTMATLTAQLPLTLPAPWANDPAARQALWASRNGLYTTVAAARPTGSTALLEDIAVPLAALPHTVDQLGSLTRANGFGEAVVFGHAKDGNLHFMVTLDLSQTDQLARFEGFTEQMVDLVLGQRGTLKAEHGTGRIMAPFVSRQFGPELYQVMRQIKALCDPEGRLNPGVLINQDPKAHLRHIKPNPPTNPAFDTCVECGYCEPTCPSCDLTTTPRQRIALLRAMAIAPPALAAQLAKDFDYQAVQTCAADSLCLLACPVNIDTGEVMKSKRSERHSARVQAAGVAAARHWGLVAGGLRAGLALNSVLPKGLAPAATGLARRVLPTEWLPLVGRDLPGPGPTRRASVTSATQDQVVYFPSCVNALFGPAEPSSSVAGVGAALQRLAAMTDLGLVIPPHIDDLCCGTVWQSKGLTDGAELMAKRVFGVLWRTSQQGQLPIVCDAVSCSLTLSQLAGHLPPQQAVLAGRLTIMDTVTFVRHHLANRLVMTKPINGIVLHPTCSMVHLETVDDLVALAGLVAQEVFLPDSWGCCGFAGDRGLLHPELTASATRPEAEAVWAAEAARGGHFDAYVSANRTCELGISRATGRTYRHILEVVAEVASSAD
ncbi:MAG: 4Fe-4S dicluster domain-containing protein, partial [Micrococcales bacterium]|nr:4Fe-4S dicluster domain-containing protein [Micrococcales bacterium]